MADSGLVAEKPRQTSVPGAPEKQAPKRNKQHPMPNTQQPKPKPYPKRNTKYSLLPTPRAATGCVCRGAVGNGNLSVVRVRVGNSNKKKVETLRAYFSGVKIGDACLSSPPRQKVHTPTKCYYQYTNLSKNIDAG